MTRTHAQALPFAKAMAAWTCALAVAVAAATALAAAAPAGKPAKPMQTIDGTTRMTVDRAGTMRECNTMAGRFGQTTWGVTQGHQMRACMSGRGQTME